MNGILLASSRTYSLSKKAAVTEWFKSEYEISSIKIPHDFDVRYVNSDMHMKDLHEEFPELKLSWEVESMIAKRVDEICKLRPLTDIMWYADELKTAFVIKTHDSFRFHHSSMFRAESVENAMRAVE